MLSFLSRAAAYVQNGSISVIGGGLAVGSAAFAGYMLANAPQTPYFGGLQHLAIFAQPSGPSQGDLAAAKERLTRELAQMKSFDMTPVGTIGAAKPVAASVPVLLPVSQQHALISLVGSQALVQSKDGVRLYGRGEDVAGFGKFLTVERFGQGWSIVTERGRIAELSGGGRPSAERPTSPAKAP